jgi:hypothetical protein
MIEDSAEAGGTQNRRLNALAGNNIHHQGIGCQRACPMNVHVRRNMLTMTAVKLTIATAT